MRSWIKRPIRTPNSTLSRLLSIAVDSPSPVVKMPRHQNYKVDETPSDDDEREECPSGTSCEKRHNVLHHRKFKHLKVTSLVEPPTSEEGGAAGEKINFD
jgi:hypothetical protein